MPYFQAFNFWNLQFTNGGFFLSAVVVIAWTCYFLFAWAAPLFLYKITTF